MTDATYDLIVVGSGAAGLSATVAARQAGLRVLLIEKTSLIGGSTSLSGGNLWLPNNPLLLRAGAPDTREAAVEYLANFVEPDDPGSTCARRAAFVDAAAPMIAQFEAAGMRYEVSAGFPDNYDHLPGGSVAGRGLRAALYNANRLGAWKAKLRPPSFPLPVHAAEGGVLLKALDSWTGRLMVARVAGRMLKAKALRQTVYGTGAALQGRMLEIALRLGSEIQTDSAMTDLVMCGERVTGVRFVHEGVTKTVHATCGVLVSVAGFARNKALRERFMPPPVDIEVTQASPGEEGDAIAAMERAGASFGWMDEAIWMMVWPFNGSLKPVMSEPAKPGSMLVDASGQRFVNEGRPTSEIGRTAMQRLRDNPANRIWFIADSKARRKYLFAFNLPGQVPDKWIAQGGVRKDETIAGLARQCGIDEAGLEATVARFNDMSREGIDTDFQRGDSAHARGMGDAKQAPNVNMGPLAMPPYWAVPLTVSDVGTYGGAITDEYARVLRADGSVIEGLYAAGNCAAPLVGPWYPAAGFSIGVSTVFGYLAARHAASRTFKQTAG